MDQHLVCPHCNQTVAVSTSLAGQAAQCPYCNGEFTVPGQAPEPQLVSYPPQHQQRPQGPGSGPGQGQGNRPRQPGPGGRSSGNLNVGGGYRNPGAAAPRPRVNRPTAPAAEGSSKLLIGVIVAMATACLPIFMFLGYRMFRGSPTVAATSTAGASYIKPANKTSAPQNGLATDSGAANTASSPATVSSNSFSPPAVQPSAPSISPSITGQSPGSPTASSPVPGDPPASVPPPSGGSSLPSTIPPPSSGTLPGSNTGSAPAPKEKEKPSSEAPGSTREVVQAVEPSVVVVEVPGVGLGSGFVIDDQGTIATNYHVIEGAKAATITFLTDKATFPVKGFAAVLPGKDLAILKIEPAGRLLKPLPMAPAAPEKGESVLAFGAPKGFGGSVSDGIVSSVRNGTELRDLLQQSTRADVYTKYLGYDLDAIWIQTTAPISGGNSGGPLVNQRGQVVGLNTWNRTDGQNLNFAISVEHLRTLSQSTQGALRPLTELPAPRKQPSGSEIASGDPHRTLEYWNEIGKVNRAMYKRMKKLARPAIAPGKRTRAFSNKMAGYYRKLAEILPEFAARLKDLDVKGVDTELVALATADAMVMESIAEDLRGWAFSAELGRSVTLFDPEQLTKKSYGGRGGSIAQAYDLMRINFNLKYGLTFPNIAGDAPQSKLEESSEDEEGEDDDKSKKAKPDDKPDDPQKAAARGLALAKQMLKNPITRDAGLEKLEKIIADYPGTPAAEEAKKLLKQFGPVKRSTAGR